MEVVRPSGGLPEKKKRKSSRFSRQTVMQTRIAKASRAIFTVPVIIKMLGELSPDEQAEFLRAYFKPAPLPRPTDEVDRLSDAQVQQLEDKLLNRVK